MKSPQIRTLLDRVQHQVGAPLVPYATNDDEAHGSAFSIPGIPATFSVHTQGGQLSPGLYDIQIESSPPGDYVYTAIVNLDRFLELVQLVCGPEGQWP